jgi:hypothetical protein
MDKRGPRERVYDEEVSPLMAKVIAISKRAGIPMVAQFELDDDEDGTPLLCTTSLVEANAGDHIKRVAATLRPQGAFAFAETVTKNPDGSMHVSIRRVL